jgi:hypothetical protein
MKGFDNDGACGAADRPQLLLFPEAGMRNLSITQWLSHEVKWKGV